jgi:ATP-dependent helicase Lhr and Lhr-like helicase
VPATALDLFQPPVGAWFLNALGQPTRAQTLGWPPIARGESTLLLAPTGSGKTLAAFLVAIDRLMRHPPRAKRERTRILYVSPLKALAIDIERNLRAPIEGIAAQAARAGLNPHVPTVDVRTGDTPAKERARMARAPADVLITTPESLYLLLTSRARETLRTIDTLIVDEIHALVATKRGAHLALSIERLEDLRPSQAPPLQRIGLSATQRPLDEVARLLGGFEDGAPRPVTVVDAGARKEIQLVVEAAGPDEPDRAAAAPRGRAPPDEPGPRAAAEPGARSVWPDVHARVVELVRAHRSTIVFVNSRRLAERLAAAVNDVAGEEIAIAHHGSLAREKRAATEERLKRGELRSIVATSSLELGIDMGAVDLVIQIESPPSVASGLQRVGRASHGVGGVPRGVLLPKHRQDLVACAAAAASMRAGEVEATFYPRNALDVLSQQIVAIASLREAGEPSELLPQGKARRAPSVPAASLRVDDLFRLVKRAAPFADLPRTAFEGVLDMLSGRYPSDDFAELRPRITWDRARGRIEPRTGAHRLAVTSGGTIPDRGLYGVFTAPLGEETGRRVGELDEEMVFELREGEVFLLGASSWRAERITHERVIVSPAPGEPGKMPFWHGDKPGRAREFGERIGALVRRIAAGRTDAAELSDTHALAPPAAAALLAYVRAQVEATGEVPSDQAIVIERFVDEVGDWRVVVLCPFGTRVIAPWAIGVAARLREAYVEVDLHYTDDGMAFRIPACETPPPPELFLPPSDAIDTLVTRALDGTALFAARFRECAARALLLPRRDPRRRTPLWAQRKRASDLLAVAARHPSFPVVLEAYRECLRDTFDLPSLTALLRDVESRRVRVTTVDTRSPSPFAASVLFAFVASFIYEADAPLAERRAQALTIDFERLRELLGEADLRSLLDPEVIAEHQASLQRLSRPAASADAVHDMLLSIGDLSLDELRARCLPDQAKGWAGALVGAGRAVVVRIAGEARFAAVEDAAKLRDALGVELGPGVPAALLEAASDPLHDLVARFARTHGPFLTADVARRFGVDPRDVQRETAKLLAEGRLVEGAFRQRSSESAADALADQPHELCARDVLDAIRRKSLAKLRRAIEPVPPAALARFVPAWQGLDQRRRGRDALLAVVGELQGCPLVGSTLESEILPARIDPYRPWDLDALCASGDVVWAGLEPIGANDGRIALYLAEHEALLAREIVPVEGATATAIRGVLARRGAVFFAEIVREVGGFPNDVLEALWQMVWAGEVTNDTLEPLRARVRSSGGEPNRRPHPRHPKARPRGLPGGEGRWSLRTSRWAETGVPHARAQRESETDRRAALARALLDRYGVVTREAAHAEGVRGGFAGIYDVLKALEAQGRVRRGYFVEGRGGAQFALPGADERLRALRDAPADSHPLVLAATDPANVWGALLDWPASTTTTDARPQRVGGAVVVLFDGALVGWMGRGEHPLLTFLPDEEPARSRTAEALARGLARLVDGGARPALLIASIDGVDPARSPLLPAFVREGFAATARGLLKRRAAPAEAQPVREAGGRR